MNIIGTKIRLLIDEPWDRSKLVEVIVIQQYIQDKKTYFLVDDIHSNEKYVITNRYIEDNLSNVTLGEKLIVAIALLDKNTMSFEDSKFISKLTYFGIGSIELPKEPK